MTRIGCIMQANPYLPTMNATQVYHMGGDLDRTKYGSYTVSINLCPTHVTWDLCPHRPNICGLVTAPLQGGASAPEGWGTCHP